MILSFNEEVNIADCLATTHWSDDVILIDSFSTDATIERARTARPDLRVFTNSFEDFGQQRNWAIDNTSPKHPWILFLDADERIPDDCARAMRQAILSDSGHAGYYLTYRNWFMGKWIKHCTLYPSWQLRLFKLGECRYKKEGHGQREVTNGSLGYINEPYDHYGFNKGIADWVDRHNAYSSNEAAHIRTLKGQKLETSLQADAVARRRQLKQIAAKAGMRPLLRFLYLYIIKGGFLDGRPGYVFCLLRVAHEIHITAKLAELEYLAQSEGAAPLDT
jgi:glycosyltransferase involved in cell wall biosynthesis